MSHQKAVRSNQFWFCELWAMRASTKEISFRRPSPKPVFAEPQRQALLASQGSSLKAPLEFMISFFKTLRL
jgi:hypothetical protein